MRLIQSTSGVSKLILVLLLIISFLFGATLSYVWTMGFYAPNEFFLPNKTNVTIENVQFFPESATYFNVTVLNPSYSRSSASIQQVKVSTGDNVVHVAESIPQLPTILSPGNSETIKAFWDWSNYTNQKVDVYVVVADGSGAVAQATTAFMNLTITNVDFEPSITSARFNITVSSTLSPVSVDITDILVNGAEVPTVIPSLPYKLNPNASITFTLNSDWADLEGKIVSISVQTDQGFAAYKTVVAPEVTLNVSAPVFFNTTATNYYFNVTIQNAETSVTKADLNSTTVLVGIQNIKINVTAPTLTPPLSLGTNESVVLTCTWNWKDFQGQTIVVTVYTVQGFKASSIETTVKAP